MSQIQQSYKAAGVDIDAAEALVERIKPLARSTDRPGVMAGIGGFGGLFDLKAAGYQDPILVASTDGVGTKLKIAIETGQHRTIGLDLVAMCVNDLVVQGAEPLFFLDYFATGKLDVDMAAQILDGVAEGCRQAGCALLGGETAEMPGFYAAGDYDLAGFVIGAVERTGLIDGRTIAEGDIVLGIASDGVHSNGYSLVRRIVEQAALTWEAAAPFSNGQTLGTALLTPTRIYTKGFRTPGIKGLAHITGGGLIENIPRVLPEGLGVELDAASWPFLPVFQWLKDAGNMTDEEMARTFNCGLGMVALCAAEDAAVLQSALEQAGEKVYTVGRVIRAADGQRVHILNTGTAWNT